MDCSPEYIKMCDCEEIQTLWEPKEGDLFADIVHPTSGKNSIFINIVTKDWGGVLANPRYTIFNKWHSEHMVERYDIWLPRQDQLQEMVNRNINYTIAIQGFEETIEVTPDFTWEQLWLGFVMKEKYGKIWDGSGWK